MQKRNIRILKDGLTVGLNTYNRGDIVPPVDHVKTLEDLADGKPLLGQTWAEWVEEPKPAEGTEPVAQVEEALAPQPEESALQSQAAEPVIESPEEVAPDPAPPAEAKPVVDLASAIKALVKDGMGKTSIVKQLAEPENISQRQVGAAFDELLATGQIVATGESGVYKVAG